MTSSPIRPSKRYRVEDLASISETLAEAERDQVPTRIAVAKVEYYWAVSSLKATGKLDLSDEDKLYLALDRACIRPADGTVVRHGKILYVRRLRRYTLPSGILMATERYWEPLAEA